MIIGVFGGYFMVVVALLGALFYRFGGVSLWWCLLV